jgi:phage-related protein
VIRLTNALGAEKILPLTMFFKRVPLEIDVPTQPLLGLDGGVVTGKPTLRPRQFTLEGRIYHPGDKERIRQDLDALLAFLMHPPIEVYREHHHDRCLIAYPLGAPQDWIDRGAELALQIPMVAPDPYWYGPEVEVTVSGTQTLTVGGTAPTYPLITTAGSVSRLVVSNALTGQEFTVTGATGVIEVDCDKRNMSVTVDGANRVDLIDDDWVLHSWALLPGENQITTNTPITLTYRPRWY